ncbi:MAG: hypothetical protein ACI89X_000743 [Planctomycetota bacterium]|jgi:hypothetical protein
MRTGIILRKAGAVLLIFLMTFVAWTRCALVFKGLQTHTWHETTGTVTSTSIIDLPPQTKQY